MDALSGVPVHKHRPTRCACVPKHVLQTEPACSGPGKPTCPGRVRTQPRGHRLVSSVEQSAGLRSRRPEVRLLHEAPDFCPVGLPARSSALHAEEVGSTPTRDASPEACRRALASTGANRPQRLGGVGTRHRQPFRALKESPCVAQPGSASALGAEGCRFESCRTDQELRTSSTRRHSSVGRAPVCRTGGRGIEARWRRQMNQTQRASTCVWVWPSPSGRRLKVVTLASPVRIRPATPKRIRPLVAEMADATVSEAVAARHARSTRAEGTNTTGEPS